MTFRKRIKEISVPYISQYKRAPFPVKGATWVLIALILLPDPFDWIPGLALMDELLYASLLLGLLHKYGALSEETEKSAADLLKEILKREVK